jgi:AbrB family looped-hinge helix DNA binding protein
MSRTLITVGENTAVTIPPELLERYGLKAGDAVEFVTSDQGITIKPVTEREPEFQRVLDAMRSAKNAPVYFNAWLITITTPKANEAFDARENGVSLASSRSLSFGDCRRDIDDM